MELKIEFKKEKGKEKNVVKKEIEKHPKRSVVTIILLVTLVIAFFAALKQSNWISMLMIVIIGALICLPAVVGKLSHIDIPPSLGIFAVVFIYATLFLGEFNNYYAVYWWWDVLLHLSSGLAFGIIGFFILYVISKAGKIKAGPKVIAMFVFAFALSIGALWEIVEFTIDSTFGPISNNAFMQTVVNGCGLVDTMKDLINDSIGGLFSAVMGYFYLKRDSGIVVKPLTKQFKKDNPRFFKKK